MVDFMILEVLLYCGQKDIYTKIELVGVWYTFTFRKGKLVAQQSYTIGDLMQMPSGVLMLQIKEVLKNF